MDGAGGDAGPPSGWRAPIGVPVPSFGVGETAPAAPDPWTGATAGWYYVCASCPGANDDASNPSGDPTHPRITIPTPLPAGAVVLVSGQEDVDESFVAQGTAAAPVFVRAADAKAPPTFTTTLQVSGSYVIVENVHVGPADATDTDFGVNVPEGSDHVVIRHSDFDGNLQRAGGISVGTWNYAGAEVASQIVIDDDKVHDLGDVAATFDQDAHCIDITGSADHVWVTHDTLRRCSGDGLQIEAQTGRRDKVHHIYYGLNTADHDRQSGGWVKHATDVIVSQNVLHDFAPNSGGPGACTGFQYGPEEVWFLFNELYACSIGIDSGDNDPPGDGLHQYAIGNLIHDIHGPPGTNPYGQGGIIVRGGTHVAVIGNTIDMVDSGINVLPFAGDAIVVDNIVTNRTLAGLYHRDLDVEHASNAALLDANLFFRPAGTSFVWDGAAVGSVADLMTASGACAHCLEVDPQYAPGWWRLQVMSPAIDTGIAAPVYAEFASRYGIDISVDADGKPRPAGTGWDLGAYERR